MSGFDPAFDPAGTSGKAGTVPFPGNIDGRSYFLRADRSWAVPGSLVPGPAPPAPGPALNQWACNIAGYLTYEVARIAVKFAVDLAPTTWLGDVVGGITAGLAAVLLPASLLVDGVLEAAIYTWVSTHITTLATDALTALLDDVLWAKVHCALYSAIAAAPTDFAAALTAAAGVIGALIGYPAAATAAIAYFLSHMGITDVANIPITAFVRTYDCSSCAVTGIGPVKPLAQTSFDLTVEDGSVANTFVDRLDFVYATVSGTTPHAIVTPDLATTISPGIGMPDNTTLTVDGTGTYSLINPMTTPADIIVGGTSGHLTRLGKGSDGQVLTVDPTTHLLVWKTPAAGDVVNPLTTKGDILVGATGGTPDRLPVGSANTLLQAVPLATDGLEWVLLQPSDIPNLDTAKLTTGLLSKARGGTGLDTSGVGDGDLLVGQAGGTWVRGGIGGGNGITVSELAGIFTIASNLTAGTNVTLTIVGGAVRIDVAGTYTLTPGLLALHSHAAGSDGPTYSSNSTTFVDIDATNLVVTFTAPSTGNVLIRATGVFTVQGSAGNAFLGLREGSSNVSGASVYVTQPDATATAMLCVAFYLSGITAGSHTYKLAYRCDNASHPARVWTGPNNGPVTIEVWAI